MSSAISSSSSLSQFSASKVWYALVPLLLLMLATRSSHFATAWSLPDASRAVFFLGGFYLARKYFAVFIGTAIAMDFLSMALGGSRACLSPGYPLIVPAFALLWFGGHLLSSNQELRKVEGRDLMFFVKAAAYWWVCASLAYAMTGAGYYFLSGKFADPTLGGWFERLQTWYAMFVAQPMLYLVAAAVVHFAVTQATRARTAHH